MKKFKLSALALFASVFGLTACDVPEFAKVPLDWAKANIVDPIANLIPGNKKEEHEDEKKEDPEVVSVKVSGLPADIDDETAPFQLSAQVEVKGEASKDVTWSSSNPAVATVDASGKVTLTGSEGEVTITATSSFDSSKSGSVSFEVFINPAILSVSIEGAPESEVLLYSGDVELSANVATKGQIAKGVNWSSSDESIATVDENGVVSLLSDGEVTITATSKSDSSKKDSVTIKIVNKGLHPELLEEGYTFSTEWPEELLEAFAGVDAPVLECVHGFYYMEVAPVIDETTGEQTKAGTFRVVADYADISLMDAFEDAAEEMGYYEFVDTSYASYGFYTFCFLDPSLKAEIDFDYYAGSEEGDTFSFIVYHVEDIWDSKEKTSDSDWSDEVKAEMTTFGEELPFVALGEDYTAEYDADYNELAIYDYCPDYTLLDSYGDVLLADGFSVSGSEEEGYVYKKTLESGDTLNVQFGFTTSGNTIVAYLTHSFPTAKLEAIFSEMGLVDRVPTYSGELLNCSLWTEGSLQIQMLVEEGTEDASLAQFVNDLLEAGYTEDEDGKRYTSEHGEITVYPWTYTSKYPGYLVVDISINLGEFPLDDVNAALTSEHDEFPIPSGTSFSFELDSEYEDSCYVTVKGGDLEAYLEDLAEANYTIDDQYVSQYNTYIAKSPSKNLVIQIEFENNSQFEINFYCTIPPVSTVSFEDAEAMFLAEGIELELPSLTDGEFIVQVQNGKIYISGASQDQLAAFEADLEEAGWTITLSYPDSDWLDATGVYNANTRAHLSIGDYIEDYGYFYISFSCDPIPTAGFPLDEVNAFLSENGFDLTISQELADALTALVEEGGGFTIETGTSFGYPWLNVAMTGEHAAEVEELFASTLEAAGYEFDDDYGKYYNSSDMSVSFAQDSGMTSIFFF